MKAYGDSKYIASIILYIDITWRWKVKIRPAGFISGKNLQYILNMRLRGPQCWSGSFWRKQNSFTSAGIRTKDLLARNPVTTPVMLSWLSHKRRTFEFCQNFRHLKKALCFAFEASRTEYPATQLLIPEASINPLLKSQNSLVSISLKIWCSFHILFNWMFCAEWSSLKKVVGFKNVVGLTQSF